MTSLLSRLLMIMVVALTPALAFQIYSEITARDLRQQFMEDEALRLLRLVAAEQRRIVEAAEQVLDVMAGSPSVQDLTQDRCQRLFDNIIGNASRYSFASVVTADSQPLCMAGSAAGGAARIDRPYVRRAMRTGAFVAGEYDAGNGTEAPAIYFAKPFKDRYGVTRGVVEVALNLKWLQHQIEQIDLPPGSIVSIADRNGIFLARRPNGGEFIGKRLFPTRRELLESDKTLIVRPTKPLDTDRPILAAFAPSAVDPQGFVVVVGLDEETAYAAVTRANHAGLALIFAGGLLALVLTAALGTRLIRQPVDRLLDVAERWRGGKLDARTGLRPDGSEFGRLGAAFDDMAESVQARDHALSAALETTTDFVMVMDRDWRIIYLNGHARDRARRPSVLGELFWAAYPDVVGTVFEQAYRTAMATGVPQKTEAYYARLNGYFEANVYPSADSLTIFIRDLSEERRAAAALRESESRLQLARQAAGFGVWDRDYVHGTLIWSDEQWRLHGLEPRPGGADMETWTATLHPEDRPRMVAERLASIAKAIPLNTEYRVVWANGGIHWLQSKTHVTHDEAGDAVLRVVGMTLDVTASRENEARLRQLSANLEARVEREVAAREAAQHRAAQAERLQALGQLAGGIAHDMNNVLQAVSGAVALIQRRPSDEAAIRRFAQLASKAIDRGASVTGRLLTFGRRSDLVTETIDIPALIGSLHEILTFSLGAAIEVGVTLPDDLPPIAADRGQLETVLINLATNARDAMPHGGRLLISAGAETVQVRDLPHPAGLNAGQYIRISVTDTGMGMDAATLARAREPFFTTKKMGAGTGLGLPMAYGFAEQSGGALTIDSRPGDGATATLWLPQADGGVRAAPPEETAPTPARRQCAKVLLVDDEYIIREVLTHVLEDAGYAVITAANGAEVLDLLAAGEVVDALITDLTMPGMDGVGVIRAVQDRWPLLPAILLTGYAQDAATLAFSVEMGGKVSLLSKPVGDSQLLDRLDSILAAVPALVEGS